MNQAIDHWFNCNDGDVPYLNVETVLHHESSSAVAIYCFGLQKTQFISGLLERTVISITQLGCPQLADISLQPSAVLLHVTTSLNMLVHCGQPTCYLSGSTFTFYVCSMQCALLSLHSINVFQMAAWGLLRRTYYLNEQKSTSPSTSIMIP